MVARRTRTLLETSLAVSLGAALSAGIVAAIVLELCAVPALGATPTPPSMQRGSGEAVQRIDVPTRTKLLFDFHVKLALLKKSAILHELRIKVIYIFNFVVARNDNT